MRRHNQDGGVFTGRQLTSSADPIETKTKEEVAIDHDSKVIGYKSAHVHMIKISSESVQCMKVINSVTNFLFQIKMMGFLFTHGKVLYS